MNELEELSSSEEKQSLARILVNCVLEEAVKRVTTPCGPGDEYQLQMELQQSLESRHEQQQQYYYNYQAQETSLLTVELEEANEALRLQLDQALMMSDDQHHHDTITLDLLREQVEELKQERDSYKCAMDSIKHSMASLLPIIPTVIRPEPLLGNVTTPTITRPIMTAGSVDSGLSSLQPSTSRVNERVWPTLPLSDGSVLKGLKSQAPPTRETTPNLSISQISDEDLPCHLTDPPRPSYIPRERAAPDLSIIHIDQSDSSIIIPPNIPANIVSEVNSIQAMIDHLHQSIETLIANYMTATTQAEDYHNRIQSPPAAGNDSQHLEIKMRSLESRATEHVNNSREVNVELEKANDKISSLIDQVEEMRRSNDEMNGKAVTEVVTLRDRLATSEREMIAQRELNKNLKEKHELSIMEMRKKLETAHSTSEQLKVKLANKSKEALDCKRLTEELREKEEVEGQLRERIAQLDDSLLSTQHQLASLESRGTTETVLLDKQLQSEKRINEELQQHLNQAITAMEKNTVQYTAQEQSYTDEISRLKGVITEREGIIRDTRTEKEAIEGQRQELTNQITVLTTQVATLHEGLEGSNDKVARLCARLEERERELEALREEQAAHSDNIDQLQVESKNHLIAYEKAIVEVQSLQDELEKSATILMERERELEQSVMHNGELTQRITNVSKTVEEKEERITQLHEELVTTRCELHQTQVQVNILQEQHVKELRELEDKVTVEHAGRLGLVKLQYSEQLKQFNSSDVLGRIAELAPKLEQRSSEVRSLCRRVGGNSVRKELLQQRDEELVQLKASLETVSTNTVTLNEENVSLKLKVTEANEMLSSLEVSMGQAGTTITDLKHQLIVLVTERDRVTATCNDLQSRLVQVEEENVKSLEAAEEKWKESVTSMEERNIALSQRLTAMEDEVKSNSPDSVCERETLVKCLEGERAAVLQLTDSLQAKELALTNAVDRYLQEKVMATTRKEELSVLRQRLREREEQMRALQSTIDSLQATRQGTGHTRKEHFLHSKLVTRLKETERKCKSLLFQKKYLLSELDAFYHTHHGALMMIQDMGGACRGQRSHKPTFKAVGVAMVAAIRLRNLTNKHHVKGRVSLSPSVPTKTTPTNRRTKSTLKTSPITSSPWHSPCITSGGKMTILMSRSPAGDNEGAGPQVAVYLNEIKRIQKQLSTKP